MGKKKLYAAAALVIIVAALAVAFAIYGTPPSGTIINAGGGSAMLIAQCADRNWISENASYIIEGTVGNLETKWENGNIITYAQFQISDYLKGNPFPGNSVLLRTAGGSIGGITQNVEDQAFFQQGEKARIYFEDYNGSYSVICGGFGIIVLDISYYHDLQTV